MGKSNRVVPVKLIQKLLGVLLRAREPLGLSVIYLYRYANNLKAWVAYVFFGGQLLESVIPSVVRLKVDCY